MDWDSLLRFDLYRDPPEQDRTQGRWMHGITRVAFTMEPGLNDIYAPRLDPGFYLGVPHEWQKGSTARYPKTYALIGSTTSHQAKAGVARAACLVHWFNIDDETKGCVGIGLRRGILKGEPAILESVAAVAKLAKLVGENPFFLNIWEKNDDIRTA